MKDVESLYTPVNLIKKAFTNDGGTRTILAGDIGGTKSNLAIFEFQGDNFRVVKEVTLKSNHFTDAQTMISSFLSDNEKPDVITLGVAGPVIAGSVSITNLTWGMKAEDISSANGFTPVHLINDLEATSYGLALLTAGDILTIHEAQREISGNIALIAPGTGLGESGLYFDGKSYHPFATEGGHCGFGPRTQLDIELYQYLSEKFGHVSWERVVSGKGIEAIFDFLSKIKAREVPPPLQQALEAGDKAKCITDHAASYEICHETLQIFLRFLAIEASNLALKMKATGGIFIGGGIIPKLIDKIEFDVFLENFRNCGRMRPLLEDVPVRIILNEKTALLGAAYYGAYKLPI